MAWKIIYQKDQIEIRSDQLNQNVMFEVNSGGIIPEYVCVHLNNKDIDELIKALQEAKAETFS